MTAAPKKMAMAREPLPQNRTRILDVRKHPNEERYPHQKIFVIELSDYVFLVPFVEDDEEIFLKTIIPS